MILLVVMDLRDHMTPKKQEHQSKDPKVLNMNRKVPKRSSTGDIPSEQVFLKTWSIKKRNISNISRANGKNLGTVAEEKNQLYLRCFWRRRRDMSMSAPVTNVRKNKKESRWLNSEKGL